MAIVDVKVPQLSESVAEATLLQWKKKPGDAVAMDEILIEVETDKVVLEVPAPAAGVMAEIVRGDSTALPWEDNRFGAVTCNCVGCFAEPQRSLKERHLMVHNQSIYDLSLPALTDQMVAWNEPSYRARQIWEGLYHEIHNEPEKADVLKVMIDWLDSQIKK